ncbi:conjugal transfer protein TraG N-terminal domain-containing protein [Pseudomonas lopnurensis]|uniref:conjugal transfer protein TraG N-terminal domain-containing protein n=1 Tax=Pseudomonas lopnurensis TaxID=1477517 RepID=UPI0028AE86A2|nr:conjugal transfer protein TraG N-terminal domain-containing protein [Pseudomonas lopnurensis]
MMTHSYLEYFLTLFGWILNNGIASILTGTGLAVFPFLGVMITNYLKARDQGADEGNKGVLALTWVETSVYSMIFVGMFGLVPIVPIQLGVIQIDEGRSQQCGRSVVQPADTAWGQTFSSLNGQSARVPMWWFLVHTFSKGITAASVATLPCGTELRQAQIAIDEMRLEDPYLRQEVGDFVRDCYANAKITLFDERPPLTKELTADVGWIGSNFFMNTAGYYDREYSRTPRADWPYDETRDAGLPPNRGGGFPTCRQWWADAGIGLRDRLIEQVPPTTWERVRNAITFASQAEAQDALLRTLVSPKRQSLTQGGIYASYNSLDPTPLFGQLAAGAAAVGTGAASTAFFPMMHAVRETMPSIVAYTIMVAIIALPLVLVLSGYDLKVFVAVSIIMFGMYFLHFWFEVARWLDSRLLEALYSSGGPNGTGFLDMTSDPVGDMYMDFTTGTMFLVIPALWMGVLGWAGFKGGDFAARSISSTGEKGGKEQSKGQGKIS